MRKRLAGMLNRYRSVVLGLAVTAVLSGGCGLSPELQARIDGAIQKEAETAALVAGLAGQMAQLAADLAAGKIGKPEFDAARDKLQAAWQEARDKAAEARMARIEAQMKAKEEGVNGWGVAGSVLLTMLLRVMGVPGLASSSGNNLAGALGRLAGRKE